MISFIHKAAEIHGNKYDYSNVIYKNNSSKVEIICPEHGPFHQSAKSHTKGHGCKLCSGSTLNTELFVERAKIIHGNRYDYSKSVYTGSTKKIIVTCKVHGDFEPIAFHHMGGTNCIKCANTTKNKKIAHSLDMWIGVYHLLHMGERF